MIISWRTNELDNQSTKLHSLYIMESLTLREIAHISARNMREILCEMKKNIALVLLREILERYFECFFAPYISMAYLLI